MGLSLFVNDGRSARHYDNGGPGNDYDGRDASHDSGSRHDGRRACGSRNDRCLLTGCQNQVCAQDGSSRSGPMCIQKRKKEKSER